ncbi:MAG: sugar phosphate isomerase/epimerase [Spirochaetales bacterium]|nr:sugar phosphate isomerase/epimerase [Spirochaetales bacterium]
MFGTSPAYIFSLYTTDFTVDDYINGLQKLKVSGFDGYQGEIFSETRLPEWEKGAKRIREAADSLGMVETQFVAHFLLMATKTEEKLFSDYGYDQFKRVIEINRILGSNVLTLPIGGPYETSGKIYGTGEYRKTWDRFVKKISDFCDFAKDADMVLAAEIVPGSILQNTDGLLRLIADSGKDNLGLNFDTGHAWASKERIEFIPSKMGGKIFGTHLKDNYTFENLPLAPGKGNIPWRSVIAGLRENGYTGSLDLEIVTEKDKVDSEYAFGKQYLLDNCRPEDIK